MERTVKDLFTEKEWQMLLVQNRQLCEAVKDLPQEIRVDAERTEESYGK